MRVLCINAQPIQGAMNLGLNLIKEGQTYTVIDIRDGQMGLAYNIGINTPQHTEYGFITYWASERFIECMDDEYEVGESNNSINMVAMKQIFDIFKQGKKF